MFYLQPQGLQDLQKLPQSIVRDMPLAALQTEGQAYKEWNPDKRRAYLIKILQQLEILAG